MTRCQRCGQETTEDRCEICKKEQGVIGQSRLTDVIRVLEKEFKDRTHGFTIGEANNTLPYNFTFTTEVLEKLRNLNILKSRVVSGTKKYQFTGRKLESIDRLGLISDYSNVKEPRKTVPKVHSDFLPRATCKYCGADVRYHQIVCSACRPKWIENLYKSIKPAFMDGGKHPIPEIYPYVVDIKKSSFYGIIDEMVKKGWIECEKIGRYKYYTLPDQTPARETIDEPVKIHPKIKKEWEDAKVNKKKLKPTISKKEQVEKPIKKVYEKPTISKIETIETPSIMQILIQILPGLLNSKIFSIEPEVKQVQAKFTGQKDLLDLYETLPEPLKHKVELTIDPTNQTQKITIPLEGVGK